MTDYVLVQKVKTPLSQDRTFRLSELLLIFSDCFPHRVISNTEPFWNPLFEVLALYWKQSGFSYNVCIYYIFHISCIFLHFWHKSKPSEMKELIFNHVYPNVVWTHGVLSYWMWTSLLWVTYTVLTLPPCPLNGSFQFTIQGYGIFLLLCDIFTHFYQCLKKKICNFEMMYFLKNVCASLELECILSGVENSDDISKWMMRNYMKNFFCSLCKKWFLYCNKSVITTTLSPRVCFYSEMLADKKLKCWSLVRCRSVCACVCVFVYRSG